ncbi:hypothetical protein SSTU70S_06629 [Stutzerimonas stutzeri]
MPLSRPQHSSPVPMEPFLMSAHLWYAKPRRYRRVTLPNPEGVWRPGLFVKVQVGAGEHTVPVAVSPDAIHTLEEKPVVFVRTDHGFAAQPIVSGRSDSDAVEIKEGLQPERAMPWITASSSSPSLAKPAPRMLTDAELSDRVRTYHSFFYRASLVGYASRAWHGSVRSLQLPKAAYGCCPGYHQRTGANQHCGARLFPAGSGAAYYLPARDGNGFHSKLEQKHDPCLDMDFLRSQLFLRKALTSILPANL